jgi:hypothetical protein
VVCNRVFDSIFLYVPFVTRNVISTFVSEMNYLSVYCQHKIYITMPLIKFKD